MRRITPLFSDVFVQYTLGSTLAFLAMAIVLALVLGHQINNQVIEDVESHALSLADSRLVPFFTPQDFEKPPSEARYQEMDSFVRRSVASPNVARIKVWNRNGQVIYSTDKSQVGQRFPIKEQLAAALDGGIGRKLSIPKDAENERERFLGTLVEVYVPVRFIPGEQPRGSFEVYEFYAPVAERISSLRRAVHLNVGVSSGVLYLLLLAIVLNARQTIRRQRVLLEAESRQLDGLNRMLQSQITTIFGEVRGMVEESAARPAPETIEAARAEHLDLIQRLRKVLAPSEG